MMRAMVCGCSPWRNLASCWGSAFCSESSLLALSSWARLTASSMRARALRAECLDEQALGILGAALRDVLLGDGQIVVLVQDRGGLGGIDGAHVGDLLGHLLQLGFVQVVEDQAGDLLAQQNQENGGLADARVRSCRQRDSSAFTIPDPASGRGARRRPARV